MPCFRLQGISLHGLRHQSASHRRLNWRVCAQDEAPQLAYARQKVRAPRTTALRCYEPPVRTYFFGARRAGEGLAMAQRFPAAYDGVVSVVPVINWTGLMHAYLPSQKRQFAGGWLPPAKITVVDEAVKNACDALDGLADGVVNNYGMCASRFNVRTLRCRTAGRRCPLSLGLTRSKAGSDDRPRSVSHANGW